MGARETRRRPQPPAGLWPSRLRRLFGSLTAAGLVWGLWATCVETVPGQMWDGAAMEAVGGVLAPRISGYDRLLLAAVSVPTLVGLMVAAGIVALLRHRPALACRALVVIAASTVSTQVLKHLVLTRPDLGVTLGAPNSFPSGHVTAAATAATALTIVVTPRLRSVVAVAGAAWTTLMGYAVVLNGWHRPSDVLAAIGVVGVWTLALAPLEEADTARRAGRFLVVAAAFIGVAGGLASVLAGIRLGVMGLASSDAQALFARLGEGGAAAWFLATGALCLVAAASLLLLAEVDRLRRPRARTSVGAAESA
ncbi:MAG: phosphatase PAP2 family protein [Actinomycetaceae bacterium]|nr:phosphatase PAP2 family protein [Actinomycetaceae bacterium]